MWYTINMMKTRENGLDIIKALATLFVVCVHFYLSVGYYQTPMISNKMYAMTFFRWGFMTAVPLFLMCTGYFKVNKTVSKSHYMSLIPILITYFILCTIRMIVENAVYGQIHTLKSGIQSLLNYQCAWYVGMYIGLMLICPFLNKIWHGCNEKEHKILVVSFIAITMIYPITLYVFSSYFQFIYPLTYYFLGAYIREYRPKVNRLLLLGIIALCMGVNSLITIFYAKGGPFVPGIFASVDNGQNTITIAVCAVSIFLLFYDLTIKNNVVATLFKSASNCSLEIYLLQAAFNAVIYTYLGRRVAAGAENYFWLFFITVPASFGLSWLASAIYKWGYNLISKRFF